jgi:hypothetical protein
MSGKPDIVIEVCRSAIADLHGSRLEGSAVSRKADIPPSILRDALLRDAPQDEGSAKQLLTSPKCTAAAP